MLDPGLEPEPGRAQAVSKLATAKPPVGATGTADSSNTTALGRDWRQVCTPPARSQV